MLSNDKLHNIAFVGFSAEANVLGLEDRAKKDEDEFRWFF